MMMPSSESTWAQIFVWTKIKIVAVRLKKALQAVD